jgi:hypothetical protein
LRSLVCFAASRGAAVGRRRPPTSRASIIPAASLERCARASTLPPGGAHRPRCPATTLGERPGTKGNRRREVGMDAWAWSDHLAPWAASGASCNTAALSISGTATTAGSRGGSFSRTRRLLHVRAGFCFNRAVSSEPASTLAARLLVSVPSSGLGDVDRQSCAGPPERRSRARCPFGEKRQL